VPSRMATDPVGEPGRLKALLLGDPSVIEAGIRVLDTDLKAGTAGTVDILALDRSGQLAVLAFSETEPEAPLRRLLDQFLWARDQYDLLARAYASQGLGAEPNVRALLLAGSYSFPFLRRLDLLAVEVTPYLVQTARIKGADAITVRPALDVFRLPSRRAAARGPTLREQLSADPVPPGLTALDFLDPVPEFRLPRDPLATRLTSDMAPHDTAESVEPSGGEPLPGESLAGDPLLGESLGAEALPDEPIPGGRYDFGSDMFVLTPASPEARSGPAPGSLADAGPTRLEDPFEPLSAEELDEFERFDRQRRERDRRSS